MTKAFRFLFLPYRKKKLLIESFIYLLTIRLGLWFLPFRTLNGWLHATGMPETAIGNVDWFLVRHVVGSVRLCSRYVPFATCLTQALAARSLLSRMGLDSDLRIGVEKDEGERFGAHAWIELDGKIIIGRMPHHHRFTVLRPSDQVVL